MEQHLSFVEGSLVRIRARFADPDTGVRVDPTAIFFESKPQATGVTTQRTYTGAADPLNSIERTATGEYRVHVPTLDLPGQLFWTFWSTGSGAAAAQGTFYVEPWKT